MLHGFDGAASEYLAVRSSVAPTACDALLVEAAGVEGARVGEREGLLGGGLTQGIDGVSRANGGALARTVHVHL